MRGRVRVGVGRRCEAVAGHLVAGDAGVDLLLAPLLGLLYEEWVGEEGPRHGYHVRMPLRQHLLGDLGCVDAVGGDERDGDGALELVRDPREASARHLGRDGGYASLVPAYTRVEDRDPCTLERLRGWGED